MITVMRKIALLGVFLLAISSMLALARVHASNVNVKAAHHISSPGDQDEPFTCSNETLEGVYGLNISGTRPVPGNPSISEQLIGVGTRTFDGEGNFTQVTNEKGSVSGLPLPDRALQGTYLVNPDCSGKLTLIIPGLPFSVIYDMVVVSHGREFRSIVASPQPVMVSTDGRRVR